MKRYFHQTDFMVSDVRPALFPKEDATFAIRLLLHIEPATVIVTDASVFLSSRRFPISGKVVEAF